MSPSSAREERTADKETARLDVFSDAVFAIAITLLILEVRLPASETLNSNRARLFALGALWRSNLALVLSFALIRVP